MMYKTVFEMLSTKRARSSRAVSFAAIASACACVSLAAGCSDKLLGVAGSIAVTPMNLAFGQTTVGTPVSITVQVSNQGSAVLTVTGVKVASDPNSELAVANLLTNDCSGNARSGSSQLSPGECAEFIATWSPTAVHDAAGSVEIDSNDAQNPAVTLAVSGTVEVITTPPPATCDPACSSDQTCCNLVCVDSQTDPLHCGGCNACATGQTCEMGKCTTPVVVTPPPAGCDDLTNPCASPDKCCDHACVDVTSTGGLCPCVGTGNVSSFGVGSIIIPMDVCWQRGVDVTGTKSYCTANAKTVGDDSPLKAYGLVFFLIRHQVTVYVAIDPNKTTIDAPDMTLVSLDNTPPVLRYNWATGAAVPLQDATQNEVEYRGGPFLIDSSQHDRVLQLLATDPDFAQFRTAGNITVHVANEGFQSAVAKTINTVPSRIALLSTDVEYYDILVRYLTSAGLNFAGAGGTPAAPGQIYDQLKQSDFLPDYDHSALKSGGYKLLWSPHWDGADTAANTQLQLASIGAFVDAGNDFFAECAAIGVLEGFTSSGGGGGVFGGGGGGGMSNEPGNAATRFQTDNGMTGNSLTLNNRTLVNSGPFTWGGLSSVFAQIGDFPFNDFSGAITDFHPATSSTYYPDVVHYVSESISGGSTDIFTSIDQHATGKGTVVYLAGHDYSYTYGSDDATTPGITAGSRMVLNTLFSLGTNNVCSPQ